jgi:predicted DNA-binding transcriptional regulator AlpA
MNAATIFSALHGRKQGSGWTARCSAHDDHTPSLSISQADDGKLLVRCRAGCDRDKIINRLGARGLWLEQPSHWRWLLPPNLVHVRSDLEYVDRSEAARVLRLAPSTLAKVRLSGNGPPCCKLGRHVVYRREDLEAWLESRIARDRTGADARQPKSLTGQPRS